MFQVSISISLSISLNLGDAADSDGTGRRRTRMTDSAVTKTCFQKETWLKSEQSGVLYR